MFSWKISLFSLFSFSCFSLSLLFMLFVMCLMNFLSYATPKSNLIDFRLCSHNPFSAQNRAREKRCWNHISRLFVDVVKVESVPFHHNGVWFGGLKGGQGWGRALIVKALSSLVLVLVVREKYPSFSFPRAWSTTSSMKFPSWNEQQQQLPWKCFSSP